MSLVAEAFVTQIAGEGEAAAGMAAEGKQKANVPPPRGALQAAEFGPGCVSEGGEAPDLWRVAWTRVGGGEAGVAQGNWNSLLGRKGRLLQRGQACCPVRFCILETPSPPFRMEACQYY